MKCQNCNAEWTVPQSVSRNLSNCPFCGAVLATALPKELSTVEDVLREIIDRFGIGTLRNGQKLVALFADLSPNLKRERLLLSYLIQADGNVRLLEVHGKNAEEQQSCYQRVCKYLVEERFVAEDAAERICMSFSTAIGLKVSRGKPAPKESAAAASGTAVPPTLPKKPATPAYTAPGTNKNTQSKPVSSAPSFRTTHPTKIDTFAKYQKALEDLYVRNGKKPLTQFQIQQFIDTHSLKQKYKITISDVQNDLSEIHEKYNPRYVSFAKGNTQSSDSGVQLVFSPFITIRTYKGYMDELEKLFLQNNKKLLSTDQITAFLRAYNLQQRFGIQASDVRQDLGEIAKKYR